MFVIECKNFVKLTEEKRIKDLMEFGLIIRKILQLKTLTENK